MVNLLLAPLHLLPLLLAPSAQQTRAAQAQPAPGTRTHIRIQQHIIVRVPRVSSPRTAMLSAAPLPPIAWVERDADQCLSVETLAGAAITRRDSVDLVMAGGKRMRAKLGDECPALGFYEGFYVRPTADRRLCAGRDIIRSRSGGECRIEGFRALVPAR
jgi:hypothetical protein